MQVHRVKPGHTLLLSPRTDAARALCGFLLQDEVSADKQFSELKLFQKILPVLSPTCFSVATHQILLWLLVFSTKPQHHQGTFLEVTCKCLHTVLTSSEASVLQQRSGGELESHRSFSVSQETCRTSYQTKTTSVLNLFWFTPFHSELIFNGAIN